MGGSNSYLQRRRCISNKLVKNSTHPKVWVPDKNLFRQRFPLPKFRPIVNRSSLWNNAPIRLSVTTSITRNGGKSKSDPERQISKDLSRLQAKLARSPALSLNVYETAEGKRNSPHTPLTVDRETYAWSPQRKEHWTSRFAKNRNGRVCKSTRQID